MSTYTLARTQTLGIPCDAYQRLPVNATDSDFHAANSVVAVKRAEHYPLIQQHFPDWLDVVEFWDVDDLDCASPEEAMRHLERNVLDLLERLPD